ncbi:MAG: hypothetical protein WCP89_02440 [archaeon]
MADVMKIEEALKKLRTEEKRKFVQSVDLIINLQNFDVRKESLNTFIQIPHPAPRKICGFLTKRSSLVDTITKDDFAKYKETKDIKRLAKKYDFFIAAAPLMGQIATAFGKILGPMNKMPSPQAGIIPIDTDDNIHKMLEKMKKSVRIRTREMSLKIAVGKEDLSDAQIKENIESAISSLERAFSKGKDNMKNVLIKFTMTKPIKIMER